MMGRGLPGWDCVKYVHGAGFPARVRTHNPAVVAWTERTGWELDLYLLCFCNLFARGGEVFLSADHEAACRAIQSVDKPVPAVKVMAARRNGPREAISYPLGYIKCQDATVAGFCTKDHAHQVFDTVALAEEALAC